MKRLSFLVFAFLLFVSTSNAFASLPAMQTMSLNFDIGQSDANLGIIEEHFSDCGTDCTYIFGNDVYILGTVAPASLNELQTYSYGYGYGVQVTTGQYVALKSVAGNYALIKIIDSKYDLHGDPYSGVDFGYWVFANGNCGSSNNVLFNSTPSSNLCNSGTASNVSGSGPWSWSCNGVNGGTNATCSANKTPEITLPAMQSMSLIFNNSVYRHVLNNVDITYSACNIDCTRVTGNAYIIGTVPPNSLNDLQSYSYQDIYDLDVAEGDYVAFSNKNGSYVLMKIINSHIDYNGDTYRGADIGYWNLSTPSVGSCGSANGSSISVAPASNLCSAGTASTVTGNGPWNWNCIGINGGTNAICSASPTVVPVTGSCGFANSGSFTAAPSNNLCNSGTASSVSGSGPWSWTCSGSNGGSSASCIALKIGQTNGNNGIISPAPGKTAPDQGDAETLFEYMLGLRQLTTDQIGSADVAPLGADGRPVGNGAIDVADLIMIMRRAAGVTSW